MKIDIETVATTLSSDDIEKLIKRYVQLSWLEFKDTYCNELGDFENYKDVFVEYLSDVMDNTDERLN